MAVSTLESIFDKAILSDAERVRVLSNVGRVYLQLGDVSAASAAFARAKDKAEKVVPDIKQVRSLLQFLLFSMFSAQSLSCLGSCTLYDRLSGPFSGTP